jgi:WD40 repeat protein
MASALPYKYPKWQYQTVGTVNLVAVSGNGAYVVGSSSDGYLYLFSTSSNVPIDAVGIGGSATVLAFSFDGKYVAVAFENILKVYNVNGNSLQLIGSFVNVPGRQGGINSLSFSSDGQYLAIGTWARGYNDATSFVHVFDVLRNATVWSAVIAILPGGSYDYVTIDFSSDGAFVAAGSTYTHKAYLYSSLNSTPVAQYDTGYSVSSVSTSYNGFYRAAGGNQIYYFAMDLTVPLWSRNVGSNIISISLSSNAEYVLASSDSGSIFLLNSNNTLSKTVASYGRDIRMVTFSANDQFFLAKSSNELLLYSMTVDGYPSTAQLDALWGFWTGPDLNSVSISSDGRYATAGSGNILYLLDTLFAPDLLPTAIVFSNSDPIEGEAVTIVATITNIGNLISPVAPIAFYADNCLIGRRSVDALAPNSDANASIVCYVSPPSVRNVKVFVDEYNNFLELDKTNNALDRNITVGVFRFEPVGNPIIFDASNTGTTTSTALSGDGHLTVAGTSDSQLSLFLTNHKSAVWSYNLPNNVEHIAMSDNGNYVAASTGNFVCCFSKHSPSPIGSFVNVPGRQGGINSLSFSSDGQYLAIGTWARGYNDATSFVHVFDVLRNATVWSAVIAILPGGSYDYVTIDFSSDGAFVAAGSTYTHKAYLYNRQSSTPLIQYDTANPLNCVSISGDGRYFAAGGNVIYFFGKDVIVPLWTHNISGTVSSISISQDSTYISATSGTRVELIRSDGNALWNASIGANANEIALSSGGENCVVRGGNYVYLFNVTADGNSATSVYDPIWQYNTGNVVNGVAISNQGESAVAASGGKMFYYSTLGQNLTAKVTNSANGQALYGVTVTLFFSDGNSQTGTTNSQGIAAISVPAAKTVTSYRATLEGYDTISSQSPPTFTSFSISMSRTSITLQIAMENTQDTYPESQNPIAKAITISNGYAPYSLRTFISGGGYNNEELATIQMNNSSTTIILPFTSSTTYTVYFTVTDRLGNSGTSQTYTITVVPPPINYTVTVKDSSNENELTGVTVILFCSDGSNYTGTTDITGMTVISVPLAKTITSYRADLAGYDTVYSQSPPETTNITILMNLTPPPITYTISVKDSANGQGLTAASVILLCSDGSNHTGTTNSEGKAEIQVPARKNVTEYRASLSGYYPRNSTVPSALTDFEIVMDRIPPPKNYTITVKDSFTGTTLENAIVTLLCSDSSNKTGTTDLQGSVTLAVPGDMFVIGYTVSLQGYGDVSSAGPPSSTSLSVSLESLPLTLDITIDNIKSTYRQNENPIKINVTISNGYLPFSLHIYASGGSYQDNQEIALVLMDGSSKTMEISLPDLAVYNLHATATDVRNNSGTSPTYTTTMTEQPLIEKRDFQIILVSAIAGVTGSVGSIAYIARRAKKKGFIRKR